MRIAQLLLYGVALWGTQVVIGVVLGLFASAQSAIFDQLMDLTLAGAAALFAYLYMRRAAAKGLLAGAIVGFIWMGLCIALDLPLLMLGDEMPPLSYAIDFLIIPIIAAAVGAAFANAAHRPPASVGDMSTAMARRDADAP
ncbi:MAG: hypothetical protein GC206_09545 [Alphaproteobacteria bacterium]|nr:hypothetical protein [Alphaproteobacteria bacterium]